MLKRNGAVAATMSQIDDKPMRHWRPPLNTEKRISIWRYSRREGQDPKDTDALYARNNPSGVAGVERGETENPRELVVMHI